jgi:tRNA-2-methylthio-N6-dimethylallyladenosine synthase
MSSGLAKTFTTPLTERLAANGLKAHVMTFGCQMNKYDSAMVSGALQGRGASFVEDEDEADVLLINTCSVRAHAEDRVYSLLGVLKRRKRNQPGLLIVVMGCLAQKEAAHIAERFPHVDLIVGTRMLDEIPHLLDRVREGAKTPLVAVDEKPDMAFGETLARRDSPFQAYLAVARGCNKRCTYCVVPYTRGPEVSRSVEEICTEARRLADDGVSELMLLGQTIDTYGRDLGTDLGALLKALHPIPGLRRIRYVTSHPEECREELFQVMHDLGDKVMPFIHMPAQSGSNRILRKMGRGYTRERYLEVVAAARKHCPEIEIAGDWIVGFSGETHDEFRQSVSLLEEVRFSFSYVFKYSVREGTPAMRLPDDVPREVKEARHHELAGVQERISLEKNRTRIGQVEAVLVEGVSKLDVTRVTGRSRHSRLVHFPGGRELAGQYVKVRITDATNLALIGEREGLCSLPH